MLWLCYYISVISDDTVTVMVTWPQGHKEHGRKFENNNIIQYI